MQIVGIRHFSFLMGFILVCACESSFAAPSAPQNLRATALAHEIRLTWERSKSGSSQQILERRKLHRASGRYRYTSVFTIRSSKRRFIDTAVRPGEKYRYRIRAAVRPEKWEWSNYAYAEIERKRPPTPTATATPNGRGSTPTPTPSPTPGVANTPSPSPTSTPTRTSTPTITPTNAPGIQVRVTASRRSCPAPCGVYFDASATTASSTSEPFQELDFLWNYGDPSASFDAMPQMPANSTHGGIGAHVFETPGNYTVSLAVRDQEGNFASTTIPISVSDPEITFGASAGGNTWCVSSSGNFTGCPAPAGNRLSSIQTALIESRFCAPGGRAVPPSGARRVLLRAGDTFDLGVTDLGTCTWTSLTNYPLLLTSFGSGPKPVIRAASRGTMYDDLPVLNMTAGPEAGTTISGIRFEGRYDASTGQGEVVPGLWLQNRIPNLTLNKLEFDGLGLSLYVDGNEDLIYSPNKVLSSLRITNYQNYGVYGRLRDGALLGSALYQKADALNVPWDGKIRCGLPGRRCASASGVGSDFGDHGGLRAFDSGHALIEYNWILSMNSWLGINARQPGIRLPVDNPIDGAGNPRFIRDVTDTVVHGNVFDPGGGSGGSSNGNQASNGSAYRIVWDSNQIFQRPSLNDSGGLGTCFGGTVFRNNLMIALPGRKTWPGYGTSGVLLGMFTFGAAGAPAINQVTLDMPVRIYNNTLVSFSRRPDWTPFAVGNDAFIRLDVERGTTTPRNFQIKNNLVVAPQLSSFFSADGAPTPTVEAEANLFLVDQSATNGDGDFSDRAGASASAGLSNVPRACSPLQTIRRSVNGTLTSSDGGLRGIITVSGAAFAQNNVVRGSMTIIKAPANSLYYSADPGDGATSQVDGLPVYSVSGDSLVLPHDPRVNKNADLPVTLEYEYHPSSISRLYLVDASNFSVGNRVSFNFDGTSRSITGKGSNSIGSYVDISPGLGAFADGVLCAWDSSSVILDLRPSTASVAVNQGVQVPNLFDISNNPRPGLFGSGWDIGAHER